ncbi:hypothetical protein GH733_012777 [Mirounga leonina]|nr:hypothetical protein GH733_012777 [Mirounga leonina]
MGPEGRARCWCCSPELSRWAADNSPTQGRCGPLSLCGHTLGQGTCCAVSWGGQDHMDGQILGQLRPLAEREEEEEEEGARAAPSARPAFPGMGSEELRLASFYDWPLTAVVRPELLAAAGFFHTGQQDKVRCFFCYGGLQSWEQGDDPWTEHAKWFPRCEFLLQTKGWDFVCNVQEACCHLPGSWGSGGAGPSPPPLLPLLRAQMFSGSFQDRLEEPEDRAPATPSARCGHRQSHGRQWEREERQLCSPCPSPRRGLQSGARGGGGRCLHLQPLPALGPVPLTLPAGAGGSQDWSAWSRCPAVRAVLRVGFGLSHTQQLPQQAPVGGARGHLRIPAGGRPIPGRGGGPAPVHTGPELPTPRREVQSEGAREPGEGGTHGGQGQLPRILTEGSPISPGQKVEVWGWTLCPWRKRVEPWPRGRCWVLEPPGARDTEEQLLCLWEERTCKVCLDRAVGTVFVPCGHLVCAECAPALQLCPICRAPIRSRVRTFLP